MHGKNMVGVITNSIESLISKYNGYSEEQYKSDLQLLKKAGERRMDHACLLIEEDGSIHYAGILSLHS